MPKIALLTFFLMKISDNKTTNKHKKLNFENTISPALPKFCDFTEYQAHKSLTFFKFVWFLNMCLNNS